MQISQCEFNSPVYWDKGTMQLIPVDDEILKSEHWNFVHSICTTTDTTLELITNPTTSASFYLEKTFNYGDFFTMGFLTIFILFGITKIIWQTFVSK